VDSKIDPVEEAASEAAAIGAEVYEPVEQAIKIIIVAFSILLLGLSISAYRKTALRRIMYAAVAFGLFAVQLFIEYLEGVILALDAPLIDVIVTGLTLVILVLFFAAIIRKK
jgi:hypothetical protein